MHEFLGTSKIAFKLNVNVSTGNNFNNKQLNNIFASRITKDHDHRF